MRKPTKKNARPETGVKEPIVRLRIGREHSASSRDPLTGKRLPKLNQHTRTKAPRDLRARLETTKAGTRETLARHQAFQSLKQTFKRIVSEHELAPDQQIPLAKMLVRHLAIEGTSSNADVLSLPDTPPDRWNDRDTSQRETATEFVRRVYGPWIAARALARRDLLTLDEPLYKAYGVRISRHPLEAIPELEAQTDWVDDAVAGLADKYSEDDLRKLGLALEYRRKRANQGDA